MTTKELEVLQKLIEVVDQLVDNQSNMIKQLQEIHMAVDNIPTPAPMDR